MTKAFGLFLSRFKTEQEYDNNCDTEEYDTNDNVKSDQNEEYPPTLNR